MSKLESKTTSTKVSRLSVWSSFFSLSFVSIIPLLFGNQWAKQYGYVVLLVYTVLGMGMIARNRDLKSFFIPSSVLFFYLSASMTIGAWGHSVSAVLSKKQYANYLALQHLDSSLSIFMLTLAVLIPVSLTSSKSSVTEASLVKFPTQKLYTFVLILVPFLFFSIDLTALGGKGTIATIVTSLVSISTIIMASSSRGFVRYFIYILLIVLNASVYSFSKRYAIFLIFPIMFLEAYNGRFKLNLSFLVKVIIAFASIFVLIMAMSIYRGYGQYDVENFLSAFKYIDQYIVNDLFLAQLLNNTEVNYLFFHAVNSIEMILSDPEKTTLGSTLTSFIFLPFPRDMFPWKPDGMITLYTTAYDPIIRAKGGSTPINIVAELFWNFWFFAPLAGAFLAWLLSKLDSALIMVREKRQSLLMVFYLFIFMNVITYARGGGTNTLVFEMIVAVFFITIANIFRNLFLPARSI